MSTITYRSLNEHLINNFQNLREEYEQKLKQWKNEVPGPHIIYSLLTKYIISLLEDSKVLKKEQELNKIFEFLEALSLNSDLFVQEVVQMTVLERLSGNKELLNQAKKYMRSETLKLTNEIEKFWDIGGYEGGTAGAIFHELKTGEKIGGKTHIRKGEELKRELEVLIENTKLTENDLETAKSLLRDLEKVLKIKPWILNYGTINEYLIRNFPNLIEDYEEALEPWGDDVPGPHVIYDVIFASYIISLLEKPESEEVKKELVKVFDFVETLALHADLQVQEIVQMTIFERLRLENWLNPARKYFRPTTLKLFDEIKKFWPSGYNDGLPNVIARELETGERVKGKSHIQKGKELVQELNKLISFNKSKNQDVEKERKLLNKLMDALKSKSPDK